MPNVCYLDCFGLWTKTSKKIHLTWNNGKKKTIIPCKIYWKNRKVLLDQREFAEARVLQLKTAYLISILSRFKAKQLWPILTTNDQAVTDIEQRRVKSIARIIGVTHWHCRYQPGVQLELSLKSSDIEDELNKQCTQNVFIIRKVEQLKTQNGKGKGEIPKECYINAHWFWLVHPISVVAVDVEIR